MNKEEKLKAGNKLFRKHLSKSATKLKTTERVTANVNLSSSLTTSMEELSSVKAGNTMPSTKGLREISKELNGLVSQPLLDATTKSSTVRYTSSPSFLTSGEYPLATANGAAEISHQSHNGDIENERKLWADEKDSLQKQIQAHTDTVNMLVSEKTSLQAQLNHLQKELSDRTREHNKTQVDLQACQVRLRTAEEEKDKMVTKKSKHEEEMRSLSEQLAHAQRELQQTKYYLDERKQENTEMTSKLTLQAAELLQVQTANAELQAKLKMAELLTQQLREGTSPVSNKVDPLQEQQLQRLSNELEQCKSTISRVTAERDRALTEVRHLGNTLHEQEQQYNQQCIVLQQQCKEQGEQLEAARETIATVQSEKDTSLVESSSQLSQLQESSHVQIQKLQDEVLNLKEQLEQHIKDNANLSKLNAEQEGVVVRLERQLSRLKEQSVDHQQLLNTITNDKETISRVLVQNNELKNQLAELQDEFVKKSEQNMELASELHSERHNCKELRELYKKEQEENSHLSQQLTSLQYDEDSTKQSQDTTDFIGDLPNEDEGLTFSLPPVVSSTPPAIEEKEELIKQLQAERDTLSSKLAFLTEEHTRMTQLYYHLQQQQQQETDVQPPLEENQDDESGQTVAVAVSHEPEQLSPQSIAQLQTNFAALQDRFTQLMTEKADLLDQLQHFEHVNIQLENETETIGEYIILYHQQRESLKKKFEQKDNFITQLIGEKDTLQGKLAELQDLVRQLLNEQQQYVQHHNQPLAVTMATHEMENSNHVVTTDIDNISKASTPESFVLLENPDHDTATSQQHSCKTANQILTLLHEIESTSKTQHQLIIPCHCCVGELISV